MRYVLRMLSGRAGSELYRACVVALALGILAAPAGAGTRLKAHGARMPQPVSCFPRRCLDQGTSAARSFNTRFAVAPASPTGAPCQPFFATDTGLTSGTVLINFTPDQVNPGTWIMTGNRGTFFPAAGTTPNDCGFNDIRQFITFDGVPNTQYDVQNIQITNTGVLTFDLTYGANGVLFGQDSACLRATGSPATGFESHLEFARSLQNYLEDNPFTDPRANSLLRGFRAAAGQAEHHLLIGARVFTSEAPGEYHEGQRLSTPAAQLPVSVSSGRLDGDAFEDLIVASSTPDGAASSVTVHFQDANGVFSNNVISVDRPIRQIVAGVNDGIRPDLLLLYGDDRVEAWHFSSSGTRESTEVLPISNVRQIVSADVDFTGDGGGDLVFLESDHFDPPDAGGYGVSVYDYLAQSEQFSRLPDNQPSALAGSCVGDFNSDGFPDIIVATASVPADQPVVALALNNEQAPGGFLMSRLSLDLSASAPVARAPIVTPIFLPCDSHQGVAINGVQFQGDGAGNFQFADAPPLDAGSTLVSEVGGDFDNDGIPDLIRIVQDADGHIVVQSYEQQDVPQPERPVITRVKINKKGKVVVNGTGIVTGTRIVFNGMTLDAAIKNGGKLVSTTAPPAIASGTEVNVQVILPDGTVSNGVLYRKP